MLYTHVEVLRALNIQAIIEWAVPFDSNLIILSEMVDSKGAICVSALEAGYSGEFQVGDFIVSSDDARFNSRDEAYDLLDRPEGTLNVRRAAAQEPSRVEENTERPLKKSRPAVPAALVSGRS